MPKPYARKSVLLDVFAVAERLRDDDIRELEAYSSLYKKPNLFTPERALGLSFFSSELCYTVCTGTGSRVAMFGVGYTPNPEVGKPWLLCTDEFVKVSREFIKQTPSYLKEMYDIYPTLTNVVHKDNKLALNWLEKACGFTLQPSPFKGFLTFYGSK